jgi:transposase
MVGVCVLDIAESSEILKSLMHSQTEPINLERLQLLYLLKTHQAESVTHAATLIGRDRTTVQRWVGKYRQGGLNTLLAPRTGQGRKSQISKTASAALQQRLQAENGFKNYGEIQQWLATEYEVSASYAVVHKHVRYQLGAKLKVPRPVSAEQDQQAVMLFKKPLHLVCI